MDVYRSCWMDDELEMFGDAARRFVQNEIVPNDARWREQKLIDRDLWNKAGEVGLLCTDIPDEYGGVGGDARHEAVVALEMGRHGISSFGHVVHSILAHYVLNYGTEQQKQSWVERDGDWFLSMNANAPAKPLNPSLNRKKPRRKRW
mgnify:CR=1 FL=1